MLKSGKAMQFTGIAMLDSFKTAEWKRVILSGRIFT